MLYTRVVQAFRAPRKRGYKKNTQVKADGFLSYPLYIGLFIKIEKDAF